jgi:hypothetical protein
MSWVAAAVAGAAVVGGVTSTMASNKAAGAQKAAADSANQVQWDMYNQSREDQKPWLDAGTNALKTLQGRLGLTDGGSGDLLRNFSAADFQTDPGYAFRLSEGAKAVNNSAAARGGLLSGAAAKALTQYNQNFASNEYQNAFNRFNTNQTNQYNRLASLAGVGQTAANNDSTAALTTGSSVANNTLSAGNARASGYVGTANAVNNTITTGINGYQGVQLTNALTRNNSSTGFNPTYQSSYSGFDSPSNYG